MPSLLGASCGRLEVQTRSKRRDDAKHAGRTPAEASGEGYVSMPANVAHGICVERLAASQRIL